MTNLGELMFEAVFPNAVKMHDSIWISKEVKTIRLETK